MRFYPKDIGFAPHFYPERLSQPAKVKKPSKIFVCSMADLFGDWVPAQWIMRIRDVAAIVAPHHTFQFLTKNPKRLQEFNPWPSNCWVGTTVTNQVDADERIPELLKVDAKVRFVSHEPLLEPISMGGYDGKMYRPWLDSVAWPVLLQWCIIGAQTGPGAVKPDPNWVQSLIDQCRAAGTPFFLKDSVLSNHYLGKDWPEKVREWPK